MTPHIWVERPIPSVEALSVDEFPPGTIAIHPDHDPVERCSCSRWESGDGDRYDSEMAGWVALVRVEAEVETVDASTWATPGRTITRYTTPWEDA